MVKFGLFLGFFVLSITLFGFLSVLSRETLMVLGSSFIIFFVFLFRRDISLLTRKYKVSLSQSEKILGFFIVISILVNFWGALTPEIAFDSLWYHLTIPKLYLTQGEVYFIPGGLLYYSGFPKLVEMLYLLPLSFGNEIGAKLIHFFLGLVCITFLTILSKEYVSRKYFLLVPAIFAGNLVFAWESTVAFNDLGYVLYEILAFYCFSKFLESRKRSWLVLLGLMLGFAVLAKLIAVMSVAVYILLLVYAERRSGFSNIVKSCVIIVAFSIVPSLPWFIFNQTTTGNPVYPFGSEYLNSSSRLLSGKITRFIENTVFAQDPISPLYLIFLPFSVVVWSRLSEKQRILFFYVVLSFIAWICLSGTGGSRFLLPFLPVYSIGVAVIVEKMSERLGRGFYAFSFTLILLILVTCILYRGAAQIDSLKYLLGHESKDEFLKRKLNFSFGDFYDTDGYLKQNINENDRVLIYGSHNLYYADFPFVHQSWYEKDEITHILTQNAELPKDFKRSQKVYSNPTTGTVLYKLN